ncbi:MAG: hypothetical protein O7C65_02080 [Planctomycetota bacterium]|nr:hypothetical protein [Planctomycetota bacterium]
MRRLPFRVMQPWSPHKGRQADLISEHHTVAAAFAEIDRLSAEMVRTGAPSDAIELVVIDADDRVVQNGRRPVVQ